MRINRIAGLIFFVAAGTGVSNAEDTKFNGNYDDSCLAPIAAYKDGLPALSGAEKMSVEDKMIKTTAMFRDVMSAFRKVQSCHQSIIINDGVEDNFAELYSGTRETGRVFDLVQAQFQNTVEEMSASALTAVEPAAGASAEANLAAEAQTFNTMDILLDSYLAIEQSEEFGKTLKKIGG